MLKEKLVRCCFTKNTEGYYGKGFLEEDEKSKKIDIGHTEWPFRYPDGEITYKMISHTKDITSKNIQRKAVVVGVRAIGLHVKNIKFKRERNNHKSTDIEIHFTHDDPMFIERPNVLAYAYFVPEDPDKNPESKKIVFNDRHFWTVYGDSMPAYKIDPIHYKKDNKTKLKTEPLLHVFLHEFMHKLGLRHDMKNHDTIMWPYSKLPTDPHAFILHDKDISRLQKKYGKRILRSKRMMETFRSRRRKRHDFKRY